jgi:hypothetical protein
MICNPLHIFIQVVNQGERDEWGLWQVWGTGGVRTGFWLSISEVEEDNKLEIGG